MYCLQLSSSQIGEKQSSETYIKGMRMNSFNVMNLVLFGSILLLLHFGVEAESSSTCSLPGMPGRDGLPGQPGRDGRDGSSGPVGPPGGKLNYFHTTIVMPFRQRCRMQITLMNTTNHCSTWS